MDLKTPASGIHLPTMNAKKDTVRAVVKGIVQTNDEPFERDVSESVGVLKDIDMDFPVLEIQGIEPESSVEIDLIMIPEKVQRLLIENVRVVLPKGGFPAHFRKIQFKRCHVRFSPDIQLNNPLGLREFAMEGCFCVDSRQMKFPETLDRLDLSRDNIFDGYPEEIRHCRLESHLGIPLSTSPEITPCCWYRELMQKRDREIKLRARVEELSECLRMQVYYLHMLQLSSQDEPHGVIPCRRRSKKQWMEEQEAYEDHSRRFLEIHSPSNPVLSVIHELEQSREGPGKSFYSLLDSLVGEGKAVELILKYEKEKTDYLFSLTGSGKFLC